jgi:hypothetical protein
MHLRGAAAGKLQQHVRYHANAGPSVMLTASGMINTGEKCRNRLGWILPVGCTKMM